MIVQAAGATVGSGLFVTAPGPKLKVGDADARVGLAIFLLGVEAGAAVRGVELAAAPEVAAAPSTGPTLEQKLSKFATVRRASESSAL